MHCPAGAINPALMSAQVPSTPPVFAAVHAWHVPLQAVLQQTPSGEQKPVSQSPSTAHVCPTAASQAPAALHAWFAGHVPCEPAGSSTHVAPPAQDWQLPLQLTAQQTASAPQKPLAQSAPALAGAHVCPSAARHWCAALHASFIIGQSPSTRHGTQLPAPSHLVPPVVQAVPDAAFIVPFTPIAHVSTTQGEGEAGTFVSSATLIVGWPMPSHAVSWQSAGMSFMTTVPALAFSVPHTPPVHVASTHALPVAGHSAAAVQPPPCPPIPPDEPVVVPAPPPPPVPSDSLKFPSTSEQPQPPSINATPAARRFHRTIFIRSSSFTLGGVRSSPRP
jgi:hypothetical protein